MRRGAAASPHLAPADHRRARPPQRSPDTPSADSSQLPTTKSCSAGGRRSAVSARYFQRDATTYAYSTDGGATGTLELPGRIGVLAAADRRPAAVGVDEILDG